MNIFHSILVFALVIGLAGCDKTGSDSPEATGADTASETQAMTDNDAGEQFEIVPGLTARILKNGYGRSAEAGDMADVHYTGWLYDESSPDYRGDKFDSSVDRGERFQFPLGAGRVIKGWDQGVTGMLIGEKRELMIAPDMGYGDRGAGGVIPPGATLVFEVELFGLVGPSDTE